MNTEIKAKKNGTKEEKKAYYKLQQKRINAKAEAAAVKDRYDIAANPLNLDAALLSFSAEIEINSLAGSFPASYNVGELLAADGTVSQRFWSEWKGESDGYGMMRGEMSFKKQITSAGIRPVKLADGRWTLSVNETPVLR